MLPAAEPQLMLRGGGAQEKVFKHLLATSYKDVCLDLAPVTSVFGVAVKPKNLCEFF